MRLILIAFFGAFLIIPLSYAAKSKESKAPTVSQCLELKNTADIFTCFDKVDAYEESLINGVYYKLMGKLKSRGETNRAALLKTAELSWIKFRDNQCEYDISLEDGPGEAAGAAKVICVIQETQNRRRVLQGMLQDEINRD